MSKRASKLFERLECPTDEDANYENTRWCNRDLIPIPKDRQTWTWQGFAEYWVIAGINSNQWGLGQQLLKLGLNVSQAMAMVIVATIVVAILAPACGWVGSHQHLGFTVTSRSSWGMRGAYWPVLNRIMAACIWMGIQMYYGGQSVKIVLSAIIGPKYYYMPNTLPASANVETVDLISFFIFVILLTPMLMVRPENLQLPFRIASIMVTAVLIGTLIWTLSANHGVGTIISSPPTQNGSALGWNMLYALNTILGTFGSGTLGQSDWTRYASTPHAALFGQAVTSPLVISITVLLGMLIASASAELYPGANIWTPFQLFHQIQASMTPTARAGTFFAGLGLLASQIALSIVLNSIAAGMDLTTLWPRYINLRRGSFIVMLIGIATCPWNFLKGVSTFITVLNGWSVFIYPMTGILLADYFIVHRRQLHLADLYIGNNTSVYWFTLGFNWRAFVSWALGLFPLLPGFVRNIQGQDPTHHGGWDALHSVGFGGWDALYFMDSELGFATSFIVHVVLNAVFPAPGNTGESDFRMAKVGVLSPERETEDSRAKGNSAASGSSSPDSGDEIK